jgi:hypothetical protein
MNIQRMKSAVFAASALVLPELTSAAGSADAAPGARRPEWVIWAALGTLMLLLLCVIAAMTWSGRRKGGGKTGLPYV